MANTHDLNEINAVGGNIYEAIIASAKRARQIHDKMYGELKKELGKNENEEEFDLDTEEREKIVKEFDKLAKPSHIALEEYLQNKLHISYKDKAEDDR